MSKRSKRMLDLVRQNDSAPNYKNSKLPVTGIRTRAAKKLKREESPIPEEFEDELIQLEDLLGDVFNDSTTSKNLIEDYPEFVDPETLIKQNLLALISNIDGENNKSEEISGSTPMASPPACENIAVQIKPCTYLPGTCNTKSSTPCNSKSSTPCNSKISKPCNSKSSTPCNSKSSTPCNSKISNPCNSKSSTPFNSKPVATSKKDGKYLRPDDISASTSMQSPVHGNSPAQIPLPTISNHESVSNSGGFINGDSTRSEETARFTPMPSPIPSHDPNCEDPFCVCCEDRTMVLRDEYENIRTPSEISTLTNAPTPSSTVSFRRKTFKTDKGRKRLVHKERWVTVQRKLKKNSGQEFVNKKGKVIEEKQMKDPCADKCRMKCNQKLTYGDRLQIFKYFWILGEKRRHWEFVIKYTTKIPKRRQTTEVTRHDRKNTFQYFLPDAEKKPIKVCKTMFLNTISLSERVVSTAWKKYDGNTVVEQDRRGRYEHSKRVYNDEMVRSVCDHVRCFPVVEAHYVRKNSTKLYLEGVDSMSRMYKLYCVWFDGNKYSSKAETKRQYREIAYANFNLAFHKPKKDRCDICHVFENKSTCTDEEKNAFLKHQSRKNIARELKRSDKHDAQVNKQVVAATFDFQKVLVTPYGEVSVLYYKRRLATLNYTIYDMGSKIGTCYMWHECIAKRGSVEVSSCLLNFIIHHVEKGVKEFRFWSDNCSGQNRNRIVFSLYLYVAKKFGVTVIHRFLEKGHTQNEGDSVHATIERSCRRKSIWVPEEWYCLVRWAKSEGDPYIVKEVKQDDIFDFKALLANKNWTKNTANEKVCWTSIREVKVNAGQYDRIEYKYDLNIEPCTIIVIRAGMRNKQRLANDFDLNQAYDGPIPISKDKYKDLTDLCKAKIIPDRYHDFYLNLPHTDAANLVNDLDDSD